MKTKQAKYLEKGDWVAGPDPKAGQPRLLARVLSVGVYQTVEGPQARVVVELPSGKSDTQQHADNIVQVWEDKDLPHVKVKRDEWPAIPTTGMVLAPVLN